MSAPIATTGYGDLALPVVSCLCPIGVQMVNSTMHKLVVSCMSAPIATTVYGDLALPVVSCLCPIGVLQRPLHYIHATV
jgi:hypothetical protein